MSEFAERLLVHSGLLYVVMLAGGFLFVTGWIPPLDPGLEPEAVAAIFSENRFKIQVGASLLGIGSVFWVSLAMAIGMQLRRIEGEFHPCTYLQLVMSFGTCMAVIMSAYLFLLACFRPLSPELLTLASDLAWLCLMGMWPPAALQGVGIIVAVLRDKSDNPIYPRWVGFFNIWIIFAALPASLVPFFRDGPFAWNGIIGFWFVAFFFFSWVLTMWFMTLKAINRQAAERAQAA